MSNADTIARMKDAALHRKWSAQSDPLWLYRSMDPDAVAWRCEQAEVDADIEGLARDEGADALARQMEADGVAPEEQRARLKAYFQDQERRFAAAE